MSSRTFIKYTDVDYISPLLEMSCVITKFNSCNTKTFEFLITHHIESTSFHVKQIGKRKRATFKNLYEVHQYMKDKMYSINENEIQIDMDFH